MRHPGVINDVSRRRALSIEPQRTPIPVNERLLIPASNSISPLVNDSVLIGTAAVKNSDSQALGIVFNCP